MKRLFLASLLAAVSFNTFAVCPPTLSGKYSGTGTYTEQSVINNYPVLGYQEYHVVSLSISGGYMTVNKEYYAGTGTGQPAGEQSTGTAPITFDKSTCTGRIGLGNDPMYFTVADSGNKIYVIHGKAPKDQFLAAEKWELVKQ